jgi:hypothetical protein
VGGLVQQGAQHVDGAALETFPADQHLGPVAGGVGAGELPAAGGEVPEVQSPAAGVTTGGDHNHDLRDIGMVGANGRPGVFRTATRRLAAARSAGAVAVMVQPRSARRLGRGGGRCAEAGWSLGLELGHQGAGIAGAEPSSGGQLTGAPSALRSALARLAWAVS